MAYALSTGTSPESWLVLRLNAGFWKAASIWPSVATNGSCSELSSIAPFVTSLKPLPPWSAVSALSASALLGSRT